MHVITGGSDAEQRRDGDYLAKDERYARTDEYLDISSWPGPQTAVRLRGRVLPGRGLLGPASAAQEPRIPLYFGGSSEAAYRVGGKHADVFAFWGEPLAETKQQIASVTGRAGRGRRRRPGSRVCFRPILGPTEELAWERAHRILDATKENVARLRAQWGAKSCGLGGDQPENSGSQRLLAAAAKGDLHDRALWTPLAAATGAGGNSTALVGTPGDGRRRRSSTTSTSA